MRRDRSHRFSGVRECPQEVGCLALITDNGHRRFSLSSTRT
jgi:hypothetical protein